MGQADAGGGSHIRAFLLIRWGMGQADAGGGRGLLSHLAGGRGEGEGEGEGDLKIDEN